MPAVWFNQQWVVDRLPPGTRVRLRGAIERGGGFVVRDYEVDDEGGGRMSLPAPVYRASEAVPSRRLRELVAKSLVHLGTLPTRCRPRLRARLESSLQARRARDPPSAETRSAEPRARAAELAFEELLALQLGLLRRRRGRAEEVGAALGTPGTLAGRYRDALPFSLTNAQEQAISEIDGDLARTEPMERLLQGDVGSGKTVVALYALVRAVERGYQGALMAPTETLAEQHFLTIEAICGGLRRRSVLLTSSLGSRVSRQSARAALASGAAANRHRDARAHPGGRRPALGLAVAVVDEQHRFGVEQRAALARDRAPHRLHMTATPIPRTLALTVYGDLSVSRDRRGRRQAGSPSSRGG